MKTEIVLKAAPREKGSASALKKPVPAVLYGKGIENKNLWVDYEDFRKVYEETGESTLINLQIENNGQPHKVLIYEVQENPVSGSFRHVDFFQVKMDEEIETEVELQFVGESPAVKAGGGVLVKNMDAIEVRCLPADLPGEIIVDISDIKTFDDYIYIKDLKIPPKVEISLDPETVVALVSPPRTEAELEQLDEKVEADVSQIEGIKKEEPTEQKEEK